VNLCFLSLTDTIALGALGGGTMCILSGVQLAKATFNLEPNLGEQPGTLLLVLNAE